MQQLSTSVSDAALALSALHAAWRLLGSSLCGVIGFGLVGVAAVWGVYRFALKTTQPDVVRKHEFLSWFASVIGTSYLAAAYYRQEDIAVMANAHVALSLAVVLLRRYLTDSANALATELTSGSAIISTLLFSIFHFNPYGIIGASLYAFAGLAVSSEGEWHGIPRVDIFHYVLAIGNISLMLGLSRASPPVYYRPSVVGV